MRAHVSSSLKSVSITRPWDIGVIFLTNEYALRRSLDANEVIAPNSALIDQRFSYGLQLAQHSCMNAVTKEMFEIEIQIENWEPKWHQMVRETVLPLPKGGHR
jgi:hypothetical protein